MNVLKWMGAFMVLGLYAFVPVSAVNELTLLPVPDKVVSGKGTFVLQKNASISYGAEELKSAANYLHTFLSASTGYALPILQGSKGDVQVNLSAEGDKGSYILEVTGRNIIIKGNGYEGVINGIATLRQLFLEKVESKTVLKVADWRIPCVKIIDKPRFEWRGMMLDVSRHFASKEEVKELLDVMALYKLNKFHWHLTDDQGWRVEIKKYPLLTEKGAWRTWNNHDRRCMQLSKEEDNSDYDIPLSKVQIVANDTLYGGFYTQEDIKEVVAYAAARGIDIIPEIDMPGHFLAAIHNYSGISCFDQVGWGEVFSSPICPGKESALQFCRDVYREIFQLFPYKYVHIGGDEVEKANWKKCPDCQRRIRENNLSDEKELQSWFIKYMEKFFNENGKQMIGWDEILEGGLSKTATVMWWRTWQPNTIKETTAQGNKVIYSPNAEFYLDYKQDKNSLRKIYDYNMLPDDLNQQQRKLVMGVQGNLWTEFVPSRERMHYMIFPRLLAIAELGWSKPQQMNWDDFSTRLLSHFKRLTCLNIGYRIPDLEGFYDSNVFVDTRKVNVICRDTSAVIRYTVDGTIPNQFSPMYTEPIVVDKTTNFMFRTFRANGKKEDIVKTRFIKGRYTEPVQVKENSPGLKAVWHEYKGESCVEIPAAAVNGSYQISEVAIPEGVKGNIGLIITGFVNIPKDDIYTFRLMSDDGSWLIIDDQVIIDNDGPHSPQELIGQHAMKSGLHPIEVRYFDHNGGLLSLKVFDSTGKEIRLRYLN